MVSSVAVKIARVPADTSLLFPTNARRLTRFMMEETYGGCRPLSAAWAQRGVLDATADSDFYSRLAYYESMRTEGRPRGSIFQALAADGSLCGFADVGAHLWLPNDGVHRLPDSEDLQRLASTGIGADGAPKTDVVLRPYVSNLVVSSSLRRCGIGRRLLAACEEEAAQWAAACGSVGGGGGACEEVWLEVSAANSNALSFYSSCGFRQAGSTRGSEVQRGEGGFSMVDVERRVLCKPLARLRGGHVAHAHVHVRAAHARAAAPAMCAPPARVHQAYTAEEDAWLWERRHEPAAEVAAALGRGEKSVVARLARLRLPSTSGHARLFHARGGQREGAGAEEEPSKGAPLRPARDCLQRIAHDPSLRSSDFSVGYRDRFRPAALEAPFDAPNEAVRGGERSLVFALPEHRIEFIKYRRRVVWHKGSRTDLVFGSTGQCRIQEVVATYAEWEEDRAAALRRARARASRALSRSLGGKPAGREALAAFGRRVGRVNAGELTAAALAEEALSPAYFGADGDGGGGEPSAGEEKAPVAAVLELVSTLPDERAALREELEAELRGRIASSAARESLRAAREATVSAKQALEGRLPRPSAP